MTGAAGPGAASPPAGSRAVRAAGGVVWRPGPHGEPEVLLVHRPRYDDWSFPKGKADAGEDDRACARREVEEETGVRARLGRDLGTVTYPDARGRTKVVHYWEMQPVAGGGFRPGPEVDRCAWLPLAQARRRLTYAHDRDVLERFAAGL